MADLKSAIIRHPLVVSPHLPVIEAIAQMSNLHTHCSLPHTAANQLSELYQTARSSCVLVVDKQQVIGILTERDVVRLNVQQQPLSILTMEQVMSSPVITLRESEFTDINAAIHLLQKHQMRHLVLLDNQECLVGLVTYTSLQQASNAYQLDTELKVRQQTETRLQETERRYASLVAIAPVGIFRNNAAGQCIYVNQQYCQITGYTPEACMGEGWQLGVHPEDHAWVIAQWQQSVQAGAPFEVECRYQRPDGDCRWICAQAVPEYDAAEQVIGYVGTLIDISDRKQAGAALHTLMEGTAAITGHNFFPALVKHIAQALEVSYVIVSEYRDGDVMQTLAFWAGDTLQSNFDYSFINTPCELTLQEGQFYCECSVQQHFPELADLNLGAESYLGVALQSADGQIIGNLCILNSKPIQSPQRVEQIVRVFAARAAVELERQRALTALEQTKQALEAKVEERVTELRTIVETIPDLLLHVRRDGTCLNYIQSPNSLGDFLPIQRNLAEVLPPEVLEQQLHRINQVITTGIAQIYEHQFEKQGHIVHEEIRIGAINSVEALLIVRDVTHRKQAEQALQDSQQFIQAVLDTIPLPVFWKDKNSVFLGCNQQSVKVMGLSSATELIGKTDFDFPPTQANAAHYQADDQAVVASGAAQLGIEETIMSPDGEQRWLETHKAPLRDGAGNVIGVVGTFQDITERRRTQEQLAKSEEALAEAQRIAHVGNWELDVHSQVIIWSKELFRMFGLNPTQTELTYAEYLQLIHPDDRGWLQQCLDQAISEGIPYTLDYRIIHPDGSLRYHEGRAEIEQDSQGRVIRLYGTALDITKRKAIETALEASRAYYQGILADQTELICRYLPDGTLTFINDAYGKFFQKSSEELIGQSFTPLLPEEDQAFAIEHINKLSVDNPVATCEHRVIVPDGSIRWLQWTDRILLDADDNLVEFQAVGRDITALKEAETHLRELSDRLKLAVESAALGIWDWDITQNRLVWDERMYQLHGIPPDQFANAYEAWLNGLHPEDREAAETLSQQARNGERDYDTEFRVVHSDGSIHFIKANALIKRDSQGEAQRMIGINYDITERKEAEAAMKRQLAAIEAATDSISILQGETFLYANQAKLDLFGYEHPKEILGKTWRSLYPLEERERCDHEIFPTLEREGAWQGEIIALRKDGSTFIEGMSLNITEDGLLICIGRDISDRKQAEQALVQAKEAAEAAAQAKSNFLAMMSHEIRTPMNGVIGMANLLLDTSLTAKQKEHTETIYRCGNSLLTIINDILDFSKIESGFLELDKHPFQLRNCLEKVLEIFAQPVAEKGLKLTYQIEPSCPNQLLGDETRLRQILVNLVGNAVKFTEQGAVTVTVSCCGQNQEIDPKKQIQLNFSIKDSGIGMPEDKLEQLFKAFSQADSSITRKYGGTGLGLAISKQLTELMGGTLSVTSEVGKGSCFSFSTKVELLPSSNGVTTRTDNQPLNSKHILLAEQYPLKILIAEDNVINQKLMTTWLKNMGYQPDVVSNGLEVIDALKRQSYDVILMDVHMPEMDGVTATAYIRQYWSANQRPNIIAVTANAMRGDREQLLAAGMDDYISKPIQVEKLIEALKKIAPLTTDSSPSLVSLQQATKTPIDDLAVTIPAGNWEQDLPLASREETDVLDRQKLCEMLEPLGGIESKDMDFFRELFLVDSDELSRDIIKAIATQNFDQLQLKAHSLKSSSASLGATSLRELCLELEIAGRQRAIVDAEKGQQLLFELRRFQQALQNL